MPMTRLIVLCVCFFLGGLATGCVQSRYTQLAQQIFRETAVSAPQESSDKRPRDGSPQSDRSVAIHEGHMGGMVIGAGLSAGFAVLSGRAPKNSYSSGKTRGGKIGYQYGESVADMKDSYLRENIRLEDRFVALETECWQLAEQNAQIARRIEALKDKQDRLLRHSTLSARDKNKILKEINELKESTDESERRMGMLDSEIERLGIEMARKNNETKRDREQPLVDPGRESNETVLADPNHNRYVNMLEFQERSKREQAGNRQSLQAMTNRFHR